MQVMPHAGSVCPGGPSSARPGRCPIPETRCSNCYHLVTTTAVNGLLSVVYLSQAGKGSLQPQPDRTLSAVGQAISWTRRLSEPGDEPFRHAEGTGLDDCLLVLTQTATPYTPSDLGMSGLLAWRSLHTVGGTRRPGPGRLGRRAGHRLTRGIPAGNAPGAGPRR